MDDNSDTQQDEKDMNNSFEDGVDLSILYEKEKP